MKYNNYIHYAPYLTFEIQVLGMLEINCRGNIRNFQFASAICWEKNCWRLSRNLRMAAMALAYLNIYQRLWFGFLIVEVTCSTWIILFTYNKLQLVKRKTIFLLLTTLFSFFLCVLFTVEHKIGDNAEKTK